jgi:hypothetical protein
MRTRIGLVVTVLSALAGTAQAGPWPIGKGHSYFKLSYAHLDSTELANPDGSKANIPRFLKQEAYLYGAVGLTDKVTALASFPLLRSSDLEDFRRETGVGDVQFGLQYQLGQGGAWLFAARALAQAPTGDVNRAQGILPTGSGVWESDLRLSAGRSLAAGRGYGFVEAGYLYRETLRDSFVYEAQVGWNAGSRLVLAWTVRGVEPFESSPREVPLGSPVGFGDGTTYLAYGPSVIFKLGGGWGAQLDVTGVAHTRNLAAGTQFSFGISRSR